MMQDRQKSGRTESELERLFHRNVVKPGSLPHPAFQFRIYDGREFVARRDFVYPHELVAIEVDGWRFHAGMKAWQHDLETDNRLVALGWVVLRFTWDDITRRPEDVIRRIPGTGTTRAAPSRPRPALNECAACFVRPIIVHC